MYYTCIKYPLPGLVHIFVYNDSHLSLNQLYVLPNILLDFSLTIKAAPHKCVIRTSQP